MHLIGSFTSRGQRLEASGLQPLIECYFQRNSWKFKGSLIEVIIDLWPPFLGIMMLKQQKKCICAASERLLLRWSKLLALLCLERTYIFFDLDCPASVYCPASVWLSDLGWTVDLGWTPLQISENENSPTTKKLRYRALSPSEQAFRSSTEHIFLHCRSSAQINQHKIH